MKISILSCLVNHIFPSLGYIELSVYPCFPIIGYTELSCLTTCFTINQFVIADTHYNMRSGHCYYMKHFLPHLPWTCNKHVMYCQCSVLYIFSKSTTQELLFNGNATSLAQTGTQKLNSFQFNTKLMLHCYQSCSDWNSRIKQLPL